MRRLFLLLILTYLQVNNLQAQTLSEIQDSCYYYLEQKDLESFNRSYIKILKAFEQEADFEIFSLEKELCSIRNKDQSIRLLLMDAQKKYGEDDFHTKRIRDIMNEIDSVNAVRVTQIIDKYGWLGAEDVGEEANDAIFLCIQHCNDTIMQNKYLPILKRAVIDGVAKGWQYAFLTDRWLMNRGKAQVYGTQTIKTKKKTYIVPLQNIDCVDKLREEIGLEPVSEYMQGFGEKWSREVYINELPECKEAFLNWYRNKR